MKKSLIAMAILAMAGSAFATQECGSHCNQVNLTQTGKGFVGAQASGSNFVVSGSAASAQSSGNGSSLSYAANRTTASSQVGVTGSALSNVAKNCDALIAGSVGVFGNVTTSTESVAFNSSTGSGSGFAAAGGVAVAQVSGKGLFAVTNQHGAVGGVVGGEAHAVTAGGAISGTNGYAAQVGGTNAGFFANASASLATQGSDKYEYTIYGRRGCTTVTGCGPATADQKVAETEAGAYSVSGHDEYSTGNAAAGTITNGAANAFALSGATGGVSDSLFSTAKLGKLKPVKPSQD